MVYFLFCWRGKGLIPLVKYFLSRYGGVMWKILVPFTILLTSGCSTSEKKCSADQLYYVDVKKYQ